MPLLKNYMHIFRLFFWAGYVASPSSNDAYHTFLYIISMETMLIIIQKESVLVPPEKEISIIRVNFHAFSKPSKIFVARIESAKYRFKASFCSENAFELKCNH